MNIEDVEPGLMVRRVRHSPPRVYACPIGFKTNIIKPKANGVGFWYIDEQGNSTTTSNIEDWEVVTLGPVVVENITHTRIVSGTYDKVSVRMSCNDGMIVSFSQWEPTADELRAAAAIFIELADALGDVKS